MKKSIVLSALAVCAFAAPNQVFAATTVTYDPNPSLTSVLVDATTGPGSFTLNYNGYSGNNAPAIPGLTSSIQFNFLNRTGNTFNFSYTLMNTSGAPIDASRVTIFGFNTDPNITGATTGAGDDFNVISSGNQPNGLAALEICFKDAGPTNNCTGASGGVAIGGSTSGTFGLTFASQLNQITMNAFSVRYQGIDSQTLGIRGGSASGVPLPPAVPEPATWAMMLAGFGLVGAGLRRRRLIGSISLNQIWGSGHPLPFFVELRQPLTIR
jgi:hypothetical protein